jgi:ceramide glucosyltransferase
MGRCIDFIPSMLVARTIDGGMRCAFGATIATRKSVLEQIGGLQSLANRIASDYHIGSMAAAAGYRVELSKYVLETDSGRESFLNLFQRELRWSRASRRLRGSVYYGLAFTYGSVYCIPLLLLSGDRGWAVIVCIATIAVRITQALVAIYSMGCPKLVWWIWALPIRDLTSFVVFVAGAFGQTIYWRGRRLQIGVGGILTE